MRPKWPPSLRREQPRLERLQRFAGPDPVRLRHSRGGRWIMSPTTIAMTTAADVHTRRARTKSLSGCAGSTRVDIAGRPGRLAMTAWILRDVSVTVRATATNSGPDAQGPAAAWRYTNRIPLWR
jgi:hypothetical protein